MKENISEVITLWAEHAAQPFQGMAKEKIEKHLSIAIGTAIRNGVVAFEGLADVVFAYKWSNKNRITVELDPSKFTGDMLIIRSKEWVE